MGFVGRHGGNGGQGGYEEERMVRGVFEMLGGRSMRGVKRDNFFTFILTICNVEYQQQSMGNTTRSSNPSNGLHKDEEF